MKRAVCLFYVLVVLAMGTATIVEECRGTDAASRYIYGSWWFVGLWALLAGVGVAYILRRRVRLASTLLLHASMVVMLCGALLTHLTSTQGMIHLRKGVKTSLYVVRHDDGSMEERSLPFALTLKEFRVIYHQGTLAPSDYQSDFVLTDGQTEEQMNVSMNHIAAHSGWRFYQSSYDDDGQGSVLSLNSDPWGIPVTYTGYTLFFLSLIWMLLDPHGAFRRLLRSPLLRRGVLMAVLSLGFLQGAAAQAALPKATAQRMGRMFILHNGRICPLQTYAREFTTKLYGSASYKGFTAEQVVSGFLFYSEAWQQEPIIRVKGAALREELDLDKYCSVNQFLDPVTGTYRLQNLVEAYWQGNHDALHKQAADIDERLQLIMELRQGISLKVFPIAEGSDIHWYSPVEPHPAIADSTQSLFIEKIFPLIYECAVTGQKAQADTLMEKVRLYQRKFGGTTLPSSTQVKAERAYNAFPLATMLFIVNLTAGFLLLFVAMRHLVKPMRARNYNYAVWASRLLMSLSLVALTVCMALRWIISGRIPMANGYETMLFVAWLVMAVALIVSRWFRLMVAFGLIMSGFFLLVSHIAAMDPAITRTMPVLNSPLLSVHVSLVMSSFALLSLTFVCGVVALTLSLFKEERGERREEREYSQDLNMENEGAHKEHSQSISLSSLLSPLSSHPTESLMLLSRLLLYPALTLLGLGIFIGAIWANVSWGNYWGWDPKEVWALITLMVYAVAAHERSLPVLARPRAYHIYMVCAFLTVLMTYFGVNYLLGGMHSYA